MYTHMMFYISYYIILYYIISYRIMLYTYYLRPPRNSRSRNRALAFSPVLRVRPLLGHRTKISQRSPAIARRRDISKVSNDCSPAYVASRNTYFYVWDARETIDTELSMDCIHRYACVYVCTYVCVSTPLCVICVCACAVYVAYLVSQHHFMQYKLVLCVRACMMHRVQCITCSMECCASTCMDIAIGVYLCIYVCTPYLSMLTCISFTCVFHDNDKYPIDTHCYPPAN